MIWRTPTRAPHSTASAPGRADFARNVNRDDILNGAAELGVDLDTHIAFVLEAMRGIKGELGL